MMCCGVYSGAPPDVALTEVALELVKRGANKIAMLCWVSAWVRALCFKVLVARDVENGTAMHRTFACIHRELHV